MLHGRDAPSTKSPGDYQMGGFRVKGGAESEGGREERWGDAERGDSGKGRTRGRREGERGE